MGRKKHQYLRELAAKMREKKILKKISTNNISSSSKNANEPAERTDLTTLETVEIMQKPTVTEHVTSSYENVNEPAELTDLTALQTMDLCPEVEKDADDIHLDVQMETAELAKEPVIGGRRIINIKNFYDKLQEVSRHGPLNCGLGCVDIVSEKIAGLHSIFTLECKMCKEKFYVSSDEGNDININNSAVLGTIAIGCGYSQLQEISATLNLPLMGYPLYQKCHTWVAKSWNTISMTTMKKAGEEEREAAIAEGRVNSKGIPVIDVIVDGCWSKRTYKKNYSALSGAAAIIGRRTGKILYMGVKNKYCCICALSENAAEHTCFKNYSGPSTGMESAILVEGFKSSMKMHGIIYGRMISDGDSATYSKLIEARPYENVTIQKIECKNHIMRNLCNKISQLKTDTKYPIRFRKYITDKKIIAIRSTIKKAMEKYTSESDAEKRAHVEVLYNDILLAHIHAFEDHSRCKQYFCNKVGEDTSDHEFKTSSLWGKICRIMSYVAAHAPSLIHNVESNKSENFNAIIAKLVGGKRINFSLKGSYENRCKGAVISHNTRGLLSKTYKHATGRSPRGKIRIYEQRKLTKKIKRKYYKKKRLILSRGEDINYGEQCAREDINLEIMEKEKKTFLENLKKTKEEREYIEKETILQSASSEWLELRRKLLTASNFGRVVKRREDISCGNLVKDLLYKECISHIKSIKHGNDFEKIAINQLSKEMLIQIEPCGLFIDEQLPYLGASPDGICKDKDMIVEIKCPIAAYNLNFEDALKQKKIPFYKLKGDKIEVNRNHNWYYQIQGQLHITKKSKCLFGLWLGENFPVKIEIIVKDDQFWTNKMEPKLTKFYLDCILPELIDPRFTRKMTIRDPVYIQEAKEKKTKYNLTKTSLAKKQNNQYEKKGKENVRVESNKLECTRRTTQLTEIIDDSNQTQAANCFKRTQYHEVTEQNLLLQKEQRGVDCKSSKNFPKISIQIFGEVSDDDDDNEKKKIKKRKLLHERQLNLDEY